MAVRFHISSQGNKSPSSILNMFLPPNRDLSIPPNLHQPLFKAASSKSNNNKCICNLNTSIIVTSSIKYQWPEVHSHRCWFAGHSHRKRCIMWFNPSPLIHWWISNNQQWCQRDSLSNNDHRKFEIISFESHSSNFSSCRATTPLSVNFYHA